MVRNKSKKFLYEGVILFVVEMVQKLPKSLNFAKKSTYFGQKPGRRWFSLVKLGYTLKNESITFLCEGAILFVREMAQQLFWSETIFWSDLPQTQPWMGSLVISVYSILVLAQNEPIKYFSSRPYRVHVEHQIQNTEKIPIFWTDLPQTQPWMGSWVICAYKILFLARNGPKKYFT